MRNVGSMNGQQVNVGLDGVALGPLNVSWSALILMLGLLPWVTMARFPHAERAAGVPLLVARVWDALPGLDTSRPLLQNALDIVDVRRGGGVGSQNDRWPARVVAAHAPGRRPFRCWRTRGHGATPPGWSTSGNLHRRSAALCAILRPRSPHG